MTCKGTFGDIRLFKERFTDNRGLSVNMLGFCFCFPRPLKPVQQMKLEVFCTRDSAPVPPALQGLGAGSPYILHPQNLQAACPFCSPPPSSPSACMQENHSRDFDKIVPVKETGEKEPPSSKGSLFILFFVQVLWCLQCCWKSMGQHQHVCKVSLSPEQRCVDREYFLHTFNIQVSFILFFSPTLHAMPAAQKAAACSLRCALASI